MSDHLNISQQKIQSLIFTIRGEQVMLDRDLAAMYQVETRVLNQAVKRNLERFPEGFRFQLSERELENWKSQIVMSNSEKMGLRRAPYAFTEQGVAMLSAVLRSDVAVKMSIEIINAFVQMRRLVGQKTIQQLRISNIEDKLVAHDHKFDRLFKALEQEELPTKGIFYDGQVFDAYTFIAKLIRKADKSLILIDNYIDDSVLTMFTKRKKGVNCICYTRNLSKALKLDLQKHNEQYDPIELRILKKAHDRFLIIDEKELYHIGASLKDLGKRWFAFSKMELASFNLMHELKKS